MSTISPTGMKTHHYGILVTFGSAALTAWQGYNGQTANLADPAVWTLLFGVATTIIGWIRNPPQGQQ